MKAASVAKWSGKHFLLLLLFALVLIGVASVSAWLLSRQSPGAGLQVAFSVKFWLLGTLWRFVIYAALIYIGFALLGGRRRYEAKADIHQLKTALGMAEERPSTMSGRDDLIGDLEAELYLAEEKIERIDHAKNILFRTPLKVWGPVLLLEGLFQLFYIVLLR